MINTRGSIGSIAFMHAIIIFERMYVFIMNLGISLGRCAAIVVFSVELLTAMTSR